MHGERWKGQFFIPFLMLKPIYVLLSNSDYGWEFKVRLNYLNLIQDVELYFNWRFVIQEYIKVII